MNSHAKTLLNITGRAMLAAIFLMSAVGNKIPNFAKVAAYMEAKGIPAASVMLVGAIVFLIAGSLSIVIGFKTRIGASMLILFLVLATYYFHGFWNFSPDTKEFEMQMIHFMKNLALVGAMVMLVVNGSGPGSLDNQLNSPSG